MTSSLAEMPTRTHADDGVDLTTRLILAEEQFLYRVAMGLVRQSADANDLVQETMLRAYRARRRFVAGTSIRAWLTTILRRLFITGMRTDRRRATQTNTDAEDVLSAVSAADAESPATETKKRAERLLERLDDDVKRAFDRLPGNYRELLILVACDGLSYPEIAGKLSIPVGTVMSRIHRARLRMQASIGAQRSVA